MNGQKICRTFHFGAEGGTSGGQFNDYLKSIKLNKDIVDWALEDLRSVTVCHYNVLKLKNHSFCYHESLVKRPEM